MRQTAWAIAALCSALVPLPGTAAPLKKAPPAVTDPDWIDKPGSEELSALYPPAAAFLGLEGKATIRCRVEVTGLLRDCRVVAQSPSNAGFGDATVAAAAYFKMSPKLVDGAPVAGGTVTIPLVWKLSEDPTEKMFDVQRVLRRRFPMEWQAMIDTLLSEPSLDPSTLSVAMDGLRRRIIAKHGQNAKNVPAASARTGLEAKVFLLSSLRKRPTLCIRAAGDEGVPVDPSTEKAVARMAVAAIEIMADARDHPTPNGRMTPADVKALRDGLDERGAEFWDALQVGREGLLSATQICDGFIAIYEAAAKLPNDAVGRFWRTDFDRRIGETGAPSPSRPTLDGPTG